MALCHITQDLKPYSQSDSGKSCSSLAHSFALSRWSSISFLLLYYTTYRGTVCRLRMAWRPCTVTVPASWLWKILAVDNHYQYPSLAFGHLHCCSQRVSGDLCPATRTRADLASPLIAMHWEYTSHLKFCCTQEVYSTLRNGAPFMTHCAITLPSAWLSKGMHTERRCMMAHVRLYSVDVTC